MSGGMATIAAGVLAAYIELGGEDAAESCCQAPHYRIRTQRTCTL